MFRHAFPLTRFLAALFGLLAAGCSTLREGPGATSATVSAHNGNEVEGALGAVFSSHGYAQMGSDKGTLIFEKPGSHTDQMLYGDFEDSRMTDRVKATIEPIDGTHFRVTCVAYAVRQPTGHFAGDSSFEDPIRRLQLFSSQLSAILEEVKRRLY